MKIRYIYFLLLLLTSACSSQLELSPVTNLTGSTFYKTADDARAVVNSCYAYLNTIYSADGIMFADLVTTDDAVPFLTGIADRPNLWRYNITPSIAYNRIYEYSYAGINRANTVADRLPAIQMDENIKNRYISEAKFIRALHYFNLVQYYGDVPLVIKETVSLEGLALKRSPVTEVYDQIEKDLTEAAAVLPVSYAPTDASRATKGAANGLLAKVYLTRAAQTKASPFWQKAATKAREVISSGIYDLWTNYEDAFSLPARGGKEAVFELQYLTDVQGNSLATGYGTRGVTIYPGRGLGIARVSPSLYNLYSDKDKRKKANFLTSYTFNGVVENLSITDPDPTKAVSFQKYWDKTSKTGAGGISFPILRYADLLLICAEALNESNGGPTNEAYGLINKIRSRAGLDLLSGLSYQEFKEAVWKERRLELAFEAQRRFDLLRTGRLLDAVKAEISFDRNPMIKPFHVLLPIPQIDMDANKSLVQNPGY